MNAKTSNSSVRVFSPEAQGAGAFDGGKITEIKPIPFPREFGGSDAIGPLFYWAWASARGDGLIPMHPHQGFEIVSYALEGEIGHTDTLGTKSRVATGGAQVMQTGSGVSHQEEMFGQRTEFFQIWFEPDLREAMTRPPIYREVTDAEFPRSEQDDGVVVKSVIGGEGPIDLVADVRMVDVTIPPGGSFVFSPGDDRFLAAMTVEGGGVWNSGSDSGDAAISRRDFSVVVKTDSIAVSAGEGGLRLVAIDGPLVVNHPLHGR